MDWYLVNILVPPGKNSLKIVAPYPLAVNSNRDKLLAGSQMGKSTPLK